MIRIAVVTDVHCDDAAIGSRRGDLGEVLLLRAVHRLNRWVRPDVMVLLGDLVNDGTTARGQAYLARVAEIVKLLESEVIVLGGNHDGDEAAFYDHLPRPQDYVDIKGYRFLTFWDAEEPGFNARRSEADLRRMATARGDWDGEIIALQHCSLFRPGTAACPYNYVNADDVIAAMRSAGASLALSGHYHEGLEVLDDEGVSFVTAAALSEEPFGFLELEVEGREVTLKQHALQMPRAYKLVDRHIHTEFAYCCENMQAEKVADLAAAFGLADFGVVEHAEQLLCGKKTWASKVYRDGNWQAIAGEDRTEEYLTRTTAAGLRREQVGLECEVNRAGRLMESSAADGRLGYRIGAVHVLDALRMETVDRERACNEFMTTVAQLLASEVDILAHPFRAFRRGRQSTPDGLFEPVAIMLRRANVAAELNFHTNEPAEGFVRACLKHGVRLAFGSDAHNTYEVGEFAGQIGLLRRCGYDGDFSDVLFSL